MGRIFQIAFIGLLASGAAWAQTPPPAAPVIGTMLAQSSEFRFQLDLHVNDAALAQMLPDGWVSAAATTGPAKDANLRLIFVDCAAITGPDNKALGKGVNRFAMLAAPVKKADGSGSGQMILGGISEEPTADGFGLYLPASRAALARATSAANGVVTQSEDWDLAATGGEHLQLHVKFVAGPGNKGGGAVKFYNPTDPSQYQIIKSDQVTDITRNVTTMPPDRVLEFSFKAGGGKFATLLDGSEKPLSWDSQPVYARTIGTP